MQNEFLWKKYVHLFQPFLSVFWENVCPRVVGLLGGALSRGHHGADHIPAGAQSRNHNKVDETLKYSE